MWKCMAVGTQHQQHRAALHNQTRWITDMGEHRHDPGIHTVQKSLQVLESKGEMHRNNPLGCESHIPFFITPPPQLSRIQVDSNHQDCFVSPTVVVLNVQRWASRSRRRKAAGLSCPAADKRVINQYFMDIQTARGDHIMVGMGSGFTWPS